MIVGCPKCKMKLKVADEKISAEGTRFKCPKCSTVLLVKKPAVQIKPLANKIIAAHENPVIVDRISKVLAAKGYEVIASYDGIDTMIKAVKELPAIAILDVALPKIFGFEVCKRLKERPETKEIKVILIGSIHDKNRYRRDPASLHGGDDYIEEHQIEELLGDKVDVLRGVKKKEDVAEPPKEEPSAEQPLPKVEAPAPPPPPKIEAPAKPEPAVKQEPPTVVDEGVEKARRLARTIVSDIYLYSSSKMEESIKNNNFYEAFASELKEGKKLYDGRIAQEVKDKGDFFREAIDNFIENKRKTLKI